jgi:thioredoxin-related protein
MATTLPSHAAELILYESPRCPWCIAWMEEIGPIYPKTEEAKKAPLRVVDLTGPLPDDITPKEPVRMTPTFLLADENGDEIGRITGYSGSEMFWWQLETLMKPLTD